MIIRSKGYIKDSEHMPKSCERHVIQILTGFYMSVFLKHVFFHQHLKLNDKLKR